MDKLADRIAGLDGPEIAEAVVSAVDRISARTDGIEARVDLLELGHDMSDERLMWVALDERLLRVEAQQVALLEAVREALQRL